MRGVQALRRSVAAERVVLDVRLIVNGPPALANAQEDSHRRREEDFSALVPVTPQPNMLMRLTQVAANALHK